MSQPLGNPSLTKLVERAQKGDKEAFGTLAHYYQLGLGAYLRGLVNTREERDELVQETLLKAWLKLPQLQEPSRFKSWLYTIATNLFRDQGRRKHVQVSSLEECNDIESTLRFEESIAERDVMRQALERVRRKGIREEYLACLLLQVEGRFSHEEIASVLAISATSVPVYASLARRELRKEVVYLEEERQMLERRRSI